MSTSKTEVVAEAARVDNGTVAETLFDLGLMYCAGRNVPRNLVAAHKWFNLAALRGSEPARTCRIEIAREMTSGEIAEAQRQARQWLILH